ncbi:MAG: hypothetical protein A2023_02830 [Sulfuricurvum sp. GWF2_44_89]|uniref:Uncharacterized protein n=1 Tax=Sulfuricurvum kujiense TaxID=148813 RepID=A0A2D3WK19_9BACT|nr:MULTISPECIES: hypothetical protein [Sulfuricurvum]OHD78721.1 MAG: hypothetical protein A2023_02830 [Sulfuricurvum sp. GWF2_44_89]OHD90405.1 MAG: hypothetical protein A2517_02705 [Sulfuricurvum sp. RIFOXYD12_FULL_44_77]OHD99428.1 MAG: hypothetical protein A2552_03335 [Sulfuricurvum sp. RIFOXYD2_FULL_44_160]DAB39380.1 MAG TPA: hypothetical protein CFH83_00995 [Sulfuricurvum kujiense]
MEHQKIDELVAKIKALESELEEQLHQEYEKFTCEITKKREELLASYRREHQGLYRYLVTTPILHFLSAPVIWSVIIPAMVLDAFVSVYQWICFPIYKITKVKRSDYIIIDRHRLGYLNSIEKLNCLYCSYFNGLMGYISEIAGRTEQYWCPIRHASRVKFMHNNYKKFFDYGDSENFRQRSAELREDLKEEKE